MYYTQSTVCQGGFLNKFLGSGSYAYARFAKGGGPTVIWVGGGLATRGLATRLLWGVREHAFPQKKFNGAIWCVMEHIFIFFLLSKSLKISFLYKNNFKL